jgi:hypothetical protein
MTQMKHLIAATLLAVTALTAHMGASAQSKLQATIPFDFTVGENRLPAGTYVIDYIQPQTILLRCPQKHKSVFVVLTSTDEVLQSPHKVIFNKYGDQYFLSEVHGGYGQTGWNIGVSKLEKRVRVEEASRATQQRTQVAMK